MWCYLASLAILGDLGQTLPTSTRVVLVASNIVRAGSAARCARRTHYMAVRGEHGCKRSTGLERWHGLLLRAPFRREHAPICLDGARMRGARRAIGERRSAVTALSHGARASGDSSISARILTARAQVIAGARPSTALGARSALTTIATRLVRAGEETGSLAAMFAHAARLESERATERVRAAVRLLEPSLILDLWGARSPLVAAALLQAIYSVRPT